MRWLAAGVPIVSGLLGIVFLLAPELKREPPPPTRRATVTELTVDPAVSFRQYLQREEQPADGYDARELARPGILIRYGFAITGYRGRKLPVRWELYGVASGELVAQDKAILLRAQANEDSGSWTNWIEAPRRRGRYYVQVRIYDEAGKVPLHVKSSEPFALPAAAAAR